jgi:predicted patatin/cPLA2 family phospholipase
LLKTGDLFGAEFCYYDIPEKYDPLDLKAYLANPMLFYAGATDIETGKPAYRSLASMDHDDVEFMRASASMPVASRPVEVDGHLYLDGGISDPIPLKAFEEMGYEKNVVILTQPRDYVKKPQKMIPVFKAALKEYPAVVDAMKNRQRL